MADEVTQEKIAAWSMMLTSAQHAQKALSEFSGWLLAGSGAAFALILSHVNDITPHLCSGTFTSGMRWLFFSLLLGGISKYLQAIVIALLGCLNEMEQRINPAIQQLILKGPGFDFKAVLAEFQTGSFPWTKYLIRRMAAKGEDDPGANYRLIAKLVQSLGAIILFQVLFLLISCGAFVAGMTG